MDAGWEANKFRLVREDRGETVAHGEAVEAALQGLLPVPRDLLDSHRVYRAPGGAGTG